jgi:putative lipoprotein
VLLLDEPTSALDPASRRHIEEMIVHAAHEEGITVLWVSHAVEQADTRGRYALRARIEHQGQLLFTNTEYIDPFGGNPVEILVQRVQSSAPSGPALEGTEWELVSLSGSDTVQGAGGRAPDLLLDAEQQRAAGFSGCNRYFGGYQRDGNPNHGSPLSFGQLAGTLMACAEGGELERAYLQALSQVNAFRIVDGQLQLLQNDEVLASFNARQ